MIKFIEYKKLNPGLYISDDGRQIVIEDLGLYYEIRGNKTFYNTNTLPNYISDEDLEHIFNDLWDNLK